MSDISLAYSTLQKTPAVLRSWQDWLRVALWIFVISAAGALVVTIAFFIANGLVIMAAGLVQAILLGAGVWKLLSHTAIRRRWVRSIVAATAVIVCLVMTCGGVYLHDLYQLAQIINGGSVVHSLLDVITLRASKLHAQFVPLVWHSGFLADMSRRVRTNGAFVSLVVIQCICDVIAMFIAVRNSPDHVWCRRCQLPWEHAKNLIFLPESKGRTLLNALGNEDADAAFELAKAAATEPLGNAWAIGRLMVCRGCGVQGVDVVIRRFYARQNTTTPLTAPIPTPDWLINTLKSTPATLAD